MPDGGNDVLRSWQKLLDPRQLRANLIAASLFLAAWELLRNSVIDHVRSFYMSGFSSSGPTLEDGYEVDVRSLNRSPLAASLQWLEAHGVLDASDVADANRIREHRNQVAHELPAYLGMATKNVDLELVVTIERLVAKVDRWWLREVEIPTNPDLDQLEPDAIPDSELVSGNMAFLQLVVSMLNSPEEEALRWYEDTMSKARAAGVAGA